GRAVHQVLAAAAWRDGGPEIVQHVSMEAEALPRLEPDGPYPELVGFRNQFAAHAPMGAARFAGELLLQRGRPFAPVLPLCLLLRHGQGHGIPPLVPLWRGPGPV